MARAMATRFAGTGSRPSSAWVMAALTLASCERLPPASDPPARRALPGSPLPADPIGSRAPEWQGLEWVQGGPLRLSELRGQVVLVRFWTDGCEYCSASAPVLRKLWEEDGPRGLQVVGLYHHKSPLPLDAEQVKAAAERLGFRFPVAIDRDWVNLERWWLAAGRRRFTSASFVLDRSGVVCFVHPGGAYCLEENADFPEGVREYRVLRAEVERLLLGLPEPFKKP
jgi:peroxiredoxin